MVVVVVVVAARTTCTVLTFHHATGVTGVTLRFACKSSSTKHGIIKPVIPIAVHGRRTQSLPVIGFFCRSSLGGRRFLREFPDWIAFNYDLVHAFRRLTHAYTYNDVLIVPWSWKLLSRLWKKKTRGKIIGIFSDWIFSKPQIRMRNNIFGEKIRKKWKDSFVIINIERFSLFKCGAKIMKTVLLNHVKPSHKRDLINKQFDDVERAYLNTLRFEALAIRAAVIRVCTTCTCFLVCSRYYI